MARSQVTVRIRRAPAIVFDAIERHAWSNDPAWEAEVLSVEPLTPAPMRVGSRVKMTRTDMGKVHDTTFEVTRLDAPREMAVRHVDGPMDFALSFVVTPAGAAESDVTVTVDASPKGAMRILAPIFALQAPGRNRRLSNQMVAAIEAATASATSAAAPGAAPARA